MLRTKRWAATAVMAVMASLAALVPAQPAAASPESCATIIAGAASGAFGWGVAAVSAVPCGGWMGDTNASYICWVSQQQWGFWAHWLVRVITEGKYSRC